MNAWLRTTTHELASVRVVDLTLRSHDAAVRTQNARMRDLREEGRRLRGRVCMSMAPSLFRELNPMGGFVPPHITKVITSFTIHYSFIFSNNLCLGCK